MFKQLFLNAYQNGQNSKQSMAEVDYKTISVLIVVAFSLTMIHYFSNIGWVLHTLSEWGMEKCSVWFFRLMYEGANARFHQLVYWVSIVIFFELVPPVVLICCFFKTPLGFYGTTTKNAMADYKVYLLMLLIMLPLVAYFSTTNSFLERYPFYQIRKGQSLFPNFFCWEVLYFLQFFSLEFFFRGFMLHGTKGQFGYYSVFVMTIPYCMIHFTKPFPEALAAIIAGVVLGTCSLKSNSIWLGVMIHCSVAFTMDFFALYHQGVLF